MVNLKQLSNELLAQSVLANQGYWMKLREVRDCKRPAYDVLVKLPGQAKGKVLFTIVL